MKIDFIKASLCLACVILFFAGRCTAPKPDFTNYTHKVDSLNKAANISRRLQTYYLDKANKAYKKGVEGADVPVTQKMREAILESDVGALLTYHLAKHPSEAERIAKLSPNAQLKAIGVIEASLASKPAPQQSKAPAPIKPLSSSSGGAADLSKMSMDDYYEHRKKQGATWARR
jgi:hypothetical protein